MAAQACVRSICSLIQEGRLVRCPKFILEISFCTQSQCLASSKKDDQKRRAFQGRALQTYSHLIGHAARAGYGTPPMEKFPPDGALLLLLQMGWRVCSLLPDPSASKSTS